MAYDPPTADASQLLVGDETGLPAIGAIVEALPAGSRARVLVEVANAAERQALPSAADLAITWLYRDGLPPGENDLLLDAVRATTFPDGPRYIWGGGEFRAMTAIKKYLQEERGIDSGAIAILNYWRQGGRH
jgi:NADPH-dependent ferric siderophore reductase